MADTKCYKMFLVFSNVVLLFVGLSVLILGVKMKWALSMLLLTNIPIILEAVKAVIATGFFISLVGIMGICGACSELKWLLLGHLISLGVIVIMEFSLGVTLMIVKKTVSTALDSPDCNNVCAASVDAAILDYALPSAGLMMTVIFIEALMVFSSTKLYFYIRDRPKVTDEEPSFITQNIQMHSVAGSRPTYVSTPQPLQYSPFHSQTSLVHQRPRAGYLVSSEQATVDDKPPDYDSLHQQPTLYSSPAPCPLLEPLGVPQAQQRIPNRKDDSGDETFSQV